MSSPLSAEQQAELEKKKVISLSLLYLTILHKSLFSPFFVSVLLSYPSSFFLGNYFKKNKLKHLQGPFMSYPSQKSITILQTKASFFSPRIYIKYPFWFSRLLFLFHLSFLTTAHSLQDFSYRHVFSPATLFLVIFNYF